MTATGRQSSSCLVLVVQSDRNALEQLVTELRRRGIDAHGVQSFEGGRDQLTRRRWDVLVADVRLGAYNGLQLAVRVRATESNMVVILTGSEADPAVEAEAATLQAHYIAEPTAEAVATLVATACGGAATLETDTATTDGAFSAGV